MKLSEIHIRDPFILPFEGCAVYIYLRSRDCRYIDSKLYCRSDRGVEEHRILPAERLQYTAERCQKARKECGKAVNRKQPSAYRRRRLRII